ncbi:hypothetical protein Ancab_004861 [Ancistrocladus abbreviatus]
MNWSRGNVIGQGSTAIVSMATLHPSRETIAVKSMELERSNSLQSEQRVHSSIQCPHIIQYKGHDITFENRQLVYNVLMEYANRGTLRDVMNREGGCLGEVRIRAYTRAILQGLEYLHDNSIAHCDIKSSNILVFDDDTVKIADLGCAKQFNNVTGSSSSSRVQIAGTPLYMAPEAARGEQQGYPADIWALGCTIIEMATGQGPWPDVSNPVSALYQIGYSGQVPKFPGFLSEQAKDFLGKCLNRAPEKRWSASELLKHPFVDKAAELGCPTDGPNSDTPTSVLDQCLWESIEELDRSAHTDLAKQSLLESPAAERIRGLIGGFPAEARIPNWDFDENWITVRMEKNCIEDHNTACVNEANMTCEQIANFPLSFETIEQLESSSIFSLGFLSWSGSIGNEHHNGILEGGLFVNYNHNCIDDELCGSFDYSMKFEECLFVHQPLFVFWGVS